MGKLTCRAGSLGRIRRALPYSNKSIVTSTLQSTVCHTTSVGCYSRALPLKKCQSES